MKILKRGTVPPIIEEVGKTLTCSNCQSVLEYFLRDIKIYQNEAGSILYVQCPICGKTKVLESVYREP